MYEIGSEFNDQGPVKEEDLFALVSGQGDVRGLRCGRDAIGFAAADILTGTGAQAQDFLVLLPALSCDSMYLPFRAHGMRVVFYALNRDLTPDLSSLRRALEGQDRAFVLLIDLFGMADIRPAVRALRTFAPQAVLIEDVTQQLPDPGAWAEDVDYRVGSIRKWLGVPDGAFAARLKGCFAASPEEGETAFTTLRARALRQKTEYLQSGGSALKSEFRRTFAEAESSLDDGACPRAMTPQSRERLAQVDIGRIRSSRRANYETLRSFLTAMPACGKLFRIPGEIPEGITPFMLPVVLQPPFSGDRDGFEKRLAERGIYAPVLWPIAGEAAAVCPVSADFSAHMLAFWIDQRYGRSDMEQTAGIFADELEKGI